MSQQTRIKLYAAACVAALLALAAQEMDFGPTVSLQRDIVILNDGVADEEMLAMLKEFLHRRFGLPVRVEKNFVDLSATSRPKRHQWELRELLTAVLGRVRGEGRCVLLTSKDTFFQDMNWSTGIARCNGTTAVVSICRLDPAFWGNAYDRARHYKRVRKIVLHELGHTFGQRDHCDDWACAVHGSGSIGEIDKTGDDYCQRCDALANAAIAAIKNKP
ncbi:MAG: archaemetzincin [Verrucomicrobia bacterium]|nr:archaemetzincin [Verrucomicrobiota bacterium]